MPRLFIIRETGSANRLEVALDEEHNSRNTDALIRVLDLG